MDRQEIREMGTQYGIATTVIGKKERVVLITSDSPYSVDRKLTNVVLDPNLLGNIDEAMKIARRMNPDHIVVIM